MMTEFEVLSLGQNRLRLLARIWLVTMIALAVLHSPGQMSVDTGVALYEGAIGRAVGWGPTFFASLLDWLGGGQIGTSLFVGANILAVYGAFFAVLTRGADPVHVSRMRRGVLVLGVVLCLNPLFLLYAGILWKDVLLATLALVSIAGLLALERNFGMRRMWLAGALILPLAAMPLVRQQGLLIALPLWCALAAIVARHWRRALAGRAIVFGLVMLLMFGSQRALQYASDATIEPLPASPTATGINTVMSYDIIGMTALSGTGEPARSHGASEAAIDGMRDTYSHERIDSSWHVPAVREYVDSLDQSRLRAAWWDGLKNEPRAYFRHRAAAFGSLMGLGSMQGCVPGYWGVYAPPEYLAALSIYEEMDHRDLMIGRFTQAISVSPVLRNWTYILLLAVGTYWACRRRRSDDHLVLDAALLGAWLYLLSYVPTTIACDLRYLFPVAAVSTLLVLHLLSRMSTIDRGASAP